MKVTRDLINQIIHVQLGSTPVHDSDPLTADVIADYDSEGALVGLELLLLTPASALAALVHLATTRPDLRDSLTRARAAIACELTQDSITGDLRAGEQ